MSLLWATLSLHTQTCDDNKDSCGGNRERPEENKDPYGGNKDSCGGNKDSCDNNRERPEENKDPCGGNKEPSSHNKETPEGSAPKASPGERFEKKTWDQIPKMATQDQLKPEFIVATDEEIPENLILLFCSFVLENILYVYTNDKFYILGCYQDMTRDHTVLPLKLVVSIESYDPRTESIKRIKQSMPPTMRKVLYKDDQVYGMVATTPQSFYEMCIFGQMISTKNTKHVNTMKSVTTSNVSFANVNQFYRELSEMLKEMDSSGQGVPGDNLQMEPSGDNLGESQDKTPVPGDNLGASQDKRPVPGKNLEATCSRREEPGDNLGASQDKTPVPGKNLGATRCDTNTTCPEEKPPSYKKSLTCPGQESSGGKQRSSRRKKPVPRS